MINLHETLLALQYGRSTKVLIDFFRISNLQDLPSLIATYIPKLKVHIFLSNSIPILKVI